MSRRDPDLPRYLALSHDPLKTDAGFCVLPLALQGLEIALRRDGTRSTCGVRPLRVGPWTRLAPGLTRTSVESGLRALAEAGRCVIDWDEEEVYWTGYIAQQPGIGSYRYAQGVLAAVKAIQSPTIRAAVITEMATIPLDTVATPPADQRFVAAAQRVRDAWSALVATANPAASPAEGVSVGVPEGVSVGVPIPEHSTQSTEHRTQDTGSSSRARDSVDVTASSPDASTNHHHDKAGGSSDGDKSTVLATVKATPAAKDSNDAATLTAAWWAEYGSRSATGPDKIEAAVAQLLSEGLDAAVVIPALVHLVTVEQFGVSAKSLRVAVSKVAKQQCPAPSRFRSDADALAAAAAAMEGRTA